jgi:5'(3')-deoxyribonucleotidase
MANELTDSPELLRLGIDLDGVVADFNGGWMRRYNEEHGGSLDPQHVVGWDGLHNLAGFESMDAFWAWARADGRSVFRDLPLMPGALDTLQGLAKHHRIVILTSRFDWAIPDTLAWLAEHHVPAREVHFLVDKHQIPCDIYLDDAPHQLEALVMGRPAATVCRAVRTWNRPVAGALDVHSWTEFAEIVSAVAERHPNGLQQAR